MIIKVKQKCIMIPKVFIILFAAMLVFAAGCKPLRPLPSENFLDVPYGPDRQNTMDVSLPGGRTGDTPVIILVHGGAWTGGDKSDFSFLRGYFFDRGFAAFSVNYRLAGVKGSGIGDILDDMENAAAFVKEKSSHWSYSSDVIFIAGHSAGGHIALLYSFSRASGDTIRGVISFCGLADLTDPELEKFLNRMYGKEKPFAKRPFDRIGLVTGPDRKMRIAYSPQFLTRNIPVLLFCGKMDNIIPWSQSDNLHKKMKERGFDSTLYVYPDMGHDITPYYGEIMKITGQWIRDRM